jgi:AraC-like DNA-binding protein
LLGRVSPFVNPESFSSMIEILRKRTRLQTEFESTKSQVSLLLHGINQGQIDAAKAAQLLGLAKRTLERRLAQEASSFRELSIESFKQRLESLLLAPGSTAEAMAEQLGYHDGSSLMRACRRIYGRSLSEIRKDLTSEPVGG